MPQFDDALAYLNEFWVPPILPHPGCTTLDDAYEFHRRTNLGELGPRLHMVYFINGYVREQRNRLMTRNAHRHTTRIARAIGSATTERVRLALIEHRHIAQSRRPRYLSEYEAAMRVGTARTARAQLATALAHGLEYSLSPGELVAHTGTGRVADVAEQARVRLAAYTSALHGLGWDRLPRPLTRLVDTATSVAPTSFAR